MLQVVSEYGVGSLGRELSVQLAHRAMKKMETEPVAAFLWATPEYSLTESVNTLRVLLGDVAVWGGTVRRLWNAQGQPSHGMVLTVLNGENIAFRGAHFPRQPTAADFLEAIGGADGDGYLLVAMEAMQPRLHRWVDLLAKSQRPALGGLIGGRLQAGRPTLIGGRAAGEGGTAVLAMEGVRVGISKGTGWRSSGLWTTVTESRGEWVRSLDGETASKTMEKTFRQPARQWAYAPLREFVRLYPLGLRGNDGEWDIRAPLHVEADGSLRMTLPMPRNARAYWMVGDMGDAIEQTENAVVTAMRALKNHAPALALVFIDWSWYYLFTSHEDLIFRSVQRLVGADTPIVGVYTYGQFFASPEAMPSRLLHNHIVVALFAES